MMKDPPSIHVDQVEPNPIGIQDGYGYEAEQAANPLKVIHRLLQGRYVYAIILGLIGALIFAVLGFWIPKPIYKSTGALRFRPVLPRVLYQSEETGVMPMFGAFVSEQANLLGRERIRDMAMTDDAWKRLGRKLTPQSQMAFQKSLVVSRSKGSTIILVSFVDQDPHAAQIGVKSVLDAYMQIYGANDVVGQADRVRILEQRRSSLTSQLTSLRQRIFSIANEFGSDALEQMYDFKVQQLNNVETQLIKVGMSMAAAGISSGKEEPEQIDVATMTIEQMAAKDPRMRKFVDQHSTAMESFQMMKHRYGANHRHSRKAKDQIDLMMVMINNHTEAIRNGKVQLGQADSRSKGSGMGIAQLKDHQKHLQDLYDATKEEMLDLGRKKLQIGNLRQEMVSVDKRLQDTKFRLEQMGVESLASGRIDIISRGDKPFSPYKDMRMPFSVAGGLGGMAVGIGSVILFGLMSTRLRNSEDACAAASNIKLLGVLPNLPHDLSDPSQIAIAGYSVHHIRTMLQLRQGSNHRQVFSVTGSAAGTGKTSLTMAMGISFAASGAKTLMIDFDMAGGGLTARLEAILRRRVGAILCESGLITSDQLEEALQIADQKRVRLSTALVELGVLTDEQLNGALSLQERASAGLLNVLDGREVCEYAVDTGTPGLSILPVGGARAHDMSRVSPASVGRMIKQARKHYDVVLIDTGPIPGSVEAPIAAAQCDGVILVVSQGDRRPQVQSAFELLYSIGAQVEGLVYNRARSYDIARSAYASSISQLSGGGSRSAMMANAYDEVWSDPSESLRQGCYGPVARAVITSDQPVGAQSDE